MLGVRKILDRELELWQDCYDNRGMRHLFIELPLYTAEFLNIWLGEPDNDILNAIYADWEGSDLYRRTEEIMEQGRHYYRKSDDVYRENRMADNFIREFDKLGSESVMGIYGSAHTDLGALDYNTRSVPCMANQLNQRYEGQIHSESLTSLAKDIDPLRIDLILVGGKEYEASYFGRQSLNGFKDFSYRDFWRLENAYDDLADSPAFGMSCLTATIL